jgi:hypothetical protein
MKRYSRRRFLSASGSGFFSTALGMVIPFARFMPAGLVPVALAEPTQESIIPHKPGLVLLNDRPINAETPPSIWIYTITISCTSKPYILKSIFPLGKLHLLTLLNLCLGLTGRYLWIIPDE